MCAHTEGNNSTTSAQSAAPAQIRVCILLCVAVTQRLEGDICMQLADYSKKVAKHQSGARESLKKALAE